MRKSFLIFLQVILLCRCGGHSSDNRILVANDTVPNTTDSIKQRALIVFPDGLYHDFGVQKELTLLTHDFIFENHGDAPLVIDNIETYCSCTKAKYPRHPVMPGDADTISITYEHGVYKSGTFSKSCIIHSNAEYELKLTVAGEFELNEQ